MISKSMVIGLIQMYAPAADPDVIAQAVDDYMDEHPEITVEDGSITEEKLAADVVETLTSLESAITSLSIEETLLRDELPGTSKTVTFDNNDNPVSIVHSANGNTVRSDVFTWGEETVTEVRTASDKRITITTNLTTLAQTISEIEEVA